MKRFWYDIALSQSWVSCLISRSNNIIFVVSSGRYLSIKNNQRYPREFSLGYWPQCIIIICLHNMSETCQCLITVRSEQAKTRYWLHILKGKLRAAGVFFFQIYCYYLDWQNVVNSF